MKISEIIGFLFKILGSMSDKQPTKEVNQPTKEVVKKKSKYKALTIDDLITSSGRYPARAKSEELTEELRKNGQILLDKVNPLLEELGFEKPSISSGFRPSAANDKTSNAGKKSAHLIMMAVDIQMPKGKAYNIDKKLLEKYDLYQEDCKYTKGKNVDWLHIQNRKASKRHFIP